jgi:hypothetical protein
MTLQPCVPRCAQVDAEPDPPELPFEDDDWEEFDPTPLEAWILDDFEWDVEELYPERGDFSDNADPLRETEE